MAVVVKRTRIMTLPEGGMHSLRYNTSVMDRRTDGYGKSARQTDRFAMTISCVSIHCLSNSITTIITCTVKHRIDWNPGYYQCK